MLDLYGYLEAYRNANAAWRARDDASTSPAGRCRHWLLHCTALNRLLAEAGANVDHRCPRTGFTPLMTAAKAGKLAALRVLLEAGADSAEVNSRGRDARYLGKRHPEVLALLDDPPTAATGGMEDGGLQTAHTMALAALEKERRAKSTMVTEYESKLAALEETGRVSLRRAHDGHSAAVAAASAEWECKLEMAVQVASADREAAVTAATAHQNERKNSGNSDFQKRPDSPTTRDAFLQARSALQHAVTDPHGGKPTTAVSSFDDESMIGSASASSSGDIELSGQELLRTELTCPQSFEAVAVSCSIAISPPASPGTQRHYLEGAKPFKMARLSSPLNVTAGPGLDAAIVQECIKLRQELAKKHQAVIGLIDLSEQLLAELFVPEQPPLDVALSRDLKRVIHWLCHSGYQALWQSSG